MDSTSVPRRTDNRSPLHTSGPAEVPVPLELLASGLMLGAIRVWVLIRHDSGGIDEPTDRLTNTLLAGFTGIPGSSIRRHLADLEAHGWLTRVEQSPRPSILTPRWPHRPEVEVEW